MLQKNKMLYGLLILFVSVAMSFTTATAQVTGEDMESQNAFTGMVVDATTGQPVANATVMVDGTDKQTTTGEDGRFTLENLGMSGTQGGGSTQGGNTQGVTLVINHENYEQLTKEVNPQEMSQQQSQQGQQGQPMTFELQPKQGQQGQEGDY